MDKPTRVPNEAMDQSRGSTEVLGEDVGVKEEAHAGISRVEGRCRFASISARIRSSSSVQCYNVIYNIYVKACYYV